MARPRKNHREDLLDAAEAVLTKEGAKALSFGSIAVESGLSKASVQSVFGTRENILDALLARWMQREQVKYEQLAGERPDARSRLLAHIKTTKEVNDEAGSRISTLLAAQVGSGSQSEYMKQWYQERIGDFRVDDEQARKRRIAYLAVEGAILIRNLVGYDISEEVWEDIFSDLEKYAQ